MSYGVLERVAGARLRTVGVLALCAATTALLGLLPGPAAALVAAAMLAGAARGIFTLLQATAVTDRWGTAYYGRLSGVLSAPSTLATALAPWAGAALAARSAATPGSSCCWPPSRWWRPPRRWAASLANPPYVTG